MSVESEREVVPAVRADCLRMAELPHTTRLFADFLTGHERVRPFFPYPPQVRGWLPRRAGELVYPSSRRAQIAEILEAQNRAWGASPKTLRQIERLRAGAAAIVTGQQVALFGGPMFSLYKALTAVKVAQELTADGVECVPIFWLATEDHDVAEISGTALLTPAGEIAELVTSSRGREDAPVSGIRLAEDVAGLVTQAQSILGDSEVGAQLAEAYRPGATFGDAFARLYSHLFAEYGVVLIDGADPRLHEIASPVYRAAVVGARDINEAQRERDRALGASGYHQQVKVTPSSTLLFWLRDGARTPIHRANGNFVVGEEKLGEAELLQRIVAEPQNFSGNVLLRPVVQDYLLPTVAYVGGPAEVAYFAQAAVVYEQLLGRITPILPRLSATIVEPRIQSLLEKYELTVEDVIRHDAGLAERLAAQTLPLDVAATFARSAEDLERSLAALRQSLERLDPTLVPAAEKAHSKMRYQVERLRTRAARAQLRRAEEVGRHAARLVDSLHPHHNLQEREIAGISMLARHGQGLLHQIYENLQPACPDHQLFYL